MSYPVIKYTRKNACSVTAFNSTDIRSVQDNVATPVTAMMVTVCITTDAFILTASINAVGPSCLLQPVLTDCNSLFPFPNIPVSFCYVRLIQPWQPNSLIPSVLQSVGDNSLIQLWYHTCIRPECATGCNRSVAFLRV